MDYVEDFDSRVQMRVKDNVCSRDEMTPIINPMCMFLGISVGVLVSKFVLM